MTKPQALQVPDDELVLIEDVFKRHVDGQKIGEIAKELGISVTRTNKYLAQAREAVYNDLMTYGKKELATIYARLNNIYDAAKAEWEATRNPKFLSEMRSVLASQRQMLGLDAAPKAAISDSVTDDTGQLIFAMDDSAYKQKEADLQKEQANAIEIIPTDISEDE
jgi:hypothetical protein